MHRLWSDSPWLKYRLAHGCYWRRCSFCDTRLEYVSRFVPVEIASLVAAADSASERTGLYGIHFVGRGHAHGEPAGLRPREPAPSRGRQKALSLLGQCPLRFVVDPDRCEYLAASGLVAVSGGIEIATDSGLEMTDKGFDLAGLVKSLVAMKRRGLLVHAYLIYGFPGQSRRDIVDSAEVCRQLFAAGLVDSAFWHRFVLTRHSRMYGEWLEEGGSWPDLRPLESPRDFANNDLGFAGERASTSSTAL